MFSKILVPVDGSTVSNLVVKTAANMAEAFGSELVLLHVMQLPLPMEVLNPSKGSSGEIYNQIKERIEKFGKRVLDNSSGGLEGLNINYSQKAVWGDPSKEILKEAGEGRYDLIIIGSRGLDDMESWLMGSVSSRVVRRSRCPVMVIR
ncbi:MAG: universal stress protein [Bacillota bacterium]